MKIIFKLKKASTERKAYTFPGRCFLPSFSDIRHDLYGWAAFRSAYSAYNPHIRSADTAAAPRQLPVCTAAPGASTDISKSAAYFASVIMHIICEENNAYGKCAACFKKRPCVVTSAFLQARRAAREFGSGRHT